MSDQPKPANDTISFDAVLRSLEGLYKRTDEDRLRALIREELRAMPISREIVLAAVQMVMQDLALMQQFRQQGAETPVGTSTARTRTS